MHFQVDKKHHHRGMDLGLRIDVLIIVASMSLTCLTGLSYRPEVDTIENTYVRLLDRNFNSYLLSVSELLFVVR